jgi:hypothetical protein
MGYVPEGFIFDARVRDNFKPFFFLSSSEIAGMLMLGNEADGAFM